MTVAQGFSSPMLDGKVIADFGAVREVVIFTGAGMSAESGIPEQRGQARKFFMEQTVLFH